METRLSTPGRLPTRSTTTILFLLLLLGLPLCIKSAPNPVVKNQALATDVFPLCYDYFVISGGLGDPSAPRVAQDLVRGLHAESGASDDRRVQVVGDGVEVVTLDAISAALTRFLETQTRHFCVVIGSHGDQIPHDNSYVMLQRGPTYLPTSTLFSLLTSKVSSASSRAGAAAAAAAAAVRAGGSDTLTFSTLVLGDAANAALKDRVYLPDGAALVTIGDPPLADVQHFADALLEHPVDFTMLDLLFLYLFTALRSGPPPCLAATGLFAFDLATELRQSPRPYMVHGGTAERMSHFVSPNTVSTAGYVLVNNKTITPRIYGAVVAVLTDVLLEDRLDYTGY
ncbi:MAG: hypothetical protein M1825_000509 [Sarcosagium campestre]|nr:MAG: hypothetical protein M1825_000509 [Sarcosagium campestre]